jgi:hypothetical protein
MNTTNKTYIINYWWTQNYGAILTAFALQSLIKDSILVDNGTDFLITKMELSKYNISNNFAKQYLKISEQINSFYKLNELNKSAGTFITGSDQVFRAFALSNELYTENFLDFATNKKIAFSASFAVSKEQFLEETSSEVIEKIKRSLKTFDFISVREKSGVDICKDIIGVDAEWIIDPVFIVEKSMYENLIQNSTIDYSDKIVSYVLDTNKEYEKAYKYLEKKYNTEVIKTSKSNISVENWLASIKNCKLLVTDSFHGMCFAIIFNKPFICISNKLRGRERFNSILEMLEIQNKCIDSINEIQNKDCLFNVDYDKVNQRIGEERQKGLDFLKQSLEVPIQKSKEKENLKFQILENRVVELEAQANLKFQIKKELWNLWLVVFHKYLPNFIKNLIRKGRNFVRERHK